VLRSERQYASVLEQLSAELADLVSAVLPAVVTIRGVTAALDDCSGSGFVIDRLGHIVTNHHVIDGLGPHISAELHEDDKVDCTLVGFDPVTDLAVLRIASEPRAALTLRGTTPRLGELCLAVGSPLGDFTESVSLGVVSGLGRSLPSLDGRWTREHMVQTDAAINPGNSGGPLVDMAGQVIGVNECGRTDGQNIGFAVPAETVSLVAAELIAHGSVERAALGVTVAARAVAVGGQKQQRLVVTQVRTASALQEGDALVSIAGRPLRDRGDLFRGLTRDLIDAPTTVEVIRDGSLIRLELTPRGASRPEGSEGGASAPT
jgi:S1-C subfamily serine protease